jgi:hypothetical protein
VVTEALVQAVPVVESPDGRVSQEIRTLWLKVSEIMCSEQGVT